MSGLELCNGPPCPRCGCQDCEVTREPDPAGTSWWGAGQARCNHCGSRFYFKERPAPASAPHQPAESVRVLPVVLCDDCGAEMRVASTTRTLRKYKCPRCGATGKRPRVGA